MSHHFTEGSSLDLSNLSWQRRSFAKSNNRGKIGLYFVPEWNHAQKCHLSVCVFLFFWVVEIYKFCHQCSINDFSLLLGLFTSQSSTEAKKVNQKWLSTYCTCALNILLKNKCLLFLEKGIKISNDCIQNVLVIVHDKSYILTFCM